MENIDSWLLFGAIAVFFGGVFIYVLFMVFLPEWVGIAGKVAKEAERSHEEGVNDTKEDLIDKLQRK